MLGASLASHDRLEVTLTQLSFHKLWPFIIGLGLLTGSHTFEKLKFKTFPNVFKTKMAFFKLKNSKLHWDEKIALALTHLPTVDTSH